MQPQCSLPHSQQPNIHTPLPVVSHISPFPPHPNSRRTITAYLMLHTVCNFWHCPLYWHSGSSTCLVSEDSLLDSLLDSRPSKYISLVFPSAQTSHVNHTASNSVGTCFLLRKLNRPEREANRWPPPSAEDKKDWVIPHHYVFALMARRGTTSRYV